MPFHKQLVYSQAAFVGIMMGVAKNALSSRAIAVALSTFGANSRSCVASAPVKLVLEERPMKLRLSVHNKCLKGRCNDVRHGESGRFRLKQQLGQERAAVVLLVRLGQVVQ